MITYDLEQRGNLSKYEYLYRCIRNDIRRGVLFAGYKLPSKRMLAQHLSISVSTVEQAYDLLASEGYVQPRKGSGFYVAHIPRSLVHINPFAIATDEEDMWQVPDFDFKANKCSLNLFPKDTWLRIMRRTLSEGNETLFETVPFNGLAELREAIARYLYEFKGIYATPDQIIIGAGTEYLYSRLLQLFGSRAVIAIGDPGYKKLADISRSVGTLWEYVPLDDEGILVDELAKSPAEIVHVSPANHFPLGIEMSSSRRKELLRWVNEDSHRYIIEDDYDSELRFSGRAQPALFTQDLNQRVIYLNTFSKTLVPSLRISYMVLPKQLMDLYARQLSFYSCTVSSFEQLTLEKFIKGGYFERHITRMANYYKRIKRLLIEEIQRSTLKEHVYIQEVQAGTQFLVKINTTLSDDELANYIKKKDIHVSFLTQYCEEDICMIPHIMVLNYSSMEEEKIEEAIRRLAEAIEEIKKAES